MTGASTKRRMKKTKKSSKTKILTGILRRKKTKTICRRCKEKTTEFTRAKTMSASTGRRSMSRRCNPMKTRATPSRKGSSRKKRNKSLPKTREIHTSRRKGKGKMRGKTSSTINSTTSERFKFKTRQKNPKPHSKKLTSKNKSKNWRTKSSTKRIGCSGVKSRGPSDPQTACSNTTCNSRRGFDWIRISPHSTTLIWRTWSNKEF